jgi:L-alanine-DL-glutamate epimerase-like enolase superfamily enzyme
VERIIVRLEHDGCFGLGEAAPTPYYGQSLDSVEATLVAVGPALPVEPWPVEAIVDGLLERFDGQRAAVAAVDAALHDLVGVLRGVPVWQMYAGMGADPARTPPTSMTIGIDSPEAIAQKVAEAQAFGILKVKVGTANDADTLRAVRKAAGPVTIRADANCGWSPDEAYERIRGLDEFGLELIEQPLVAGQLDALRALRGRLAGSPPIIADEDCVRPQDVARLAGCVDGINIKLSKCGGLVPAARMILDARQTGLMVMIGCMVETSLGVLAAAQLASLADFVDLDGHLLLADDPFTGLALEGGVVRPGDRPGLGVEMKWPDSLTDWVSVA